MHNILTQLHGFVKTDKRVKLVSISVGLLGLFLADAFLLGVSYASNRHQPRPIYVKKEELVENARLKEANQHLPTSDSESQEILPPKSDYVASKNGTRYYFTWCGGVGRIKEENKVYFQTAEEARKAGYTPAKNCSGLD